ncbi:negative cofactor 2 transcription regulator complex subunit ncb2 [Tulasnella sp. 330]|nr:negative cofactor 2 transcription regulator complex subunit ncb2 [Tulasnella sp. 330]KAG8877575.1 negative cofactor 2 transcription regulator complex subunit ncb2 [Tulasnella sp. 331]KAG8880446.1 negative cofactor 2 transcription regulator complex subunit ncb2 [Tulasnella sp. 332]
MSDREGPSGAGDDELTLPKATVYKCIQELLPNELTCSKETRDLIIECCVEFIHMISTEANDICEKESRKTISPEHVVGALKLLGFEDYVEEVQDVLKEHKQQLKDREKKVSKFEASGLTEAELLAQQESLFNAARLRAAGARSSESGPSTMAPPDSPEE